MLEMLLEAGGDPNQVDKKGRNVVALLMGKHKRRRIFKPALIECLIRGGLDLKSLSKSELNRIKIGSIIKA